MPKITLHEGPSYGGHVDISPDDATEPEWVRAADLDVDEDEADEASESDPAAPRKRGRHEKS